MANQPPPYTEAIKTDGPNYGSVPAGAYQGPPQGYPGGTPQGYPGGAPQGYPGGAPQGYPGGAPQGYPSGPAGAYQVPPPQGYPAGAVPQGGYIDPSKYPPAGAAPTYQSYNIAVQPQTQVVMVGGCPACRVGVLEEDFTCLGVLCAILFFPIGILCCLAMRQRRCANCGAVFG